MLPITSMRKNADRFNIDMMNYLYSELHDDLHELINAHDKVCSGTESLEDLKAVLIKLGNIASKVAKQLSTIGNRLFIVLRNIAEKTFAKYGVLMLRWERRLKNKMNLIDEEKFLNRTVRMVDHDVLKKRIHALNKVQFIVANMERICELPIKPDSDDWRTPEFISAYNAMIEIGFDTNKFNLVKNVATDYDDAKYKATIKVHGYDLNSLSELIRELTVVTKYIDTTSVKKLNERFAKYSEQLTNYEKAIKSNDDISDEDKRDRLHHLDIKISRLWWISHFIKALYHVTEDVVHDVFLLCKVAESSVIKKEVHSESHVF